MGRTSKRVSSTSVRHLDTGFDERKMSTGDIACLLFDISFNLIKYILLMISLFLFQVDLSTGRIMDRRNIIGIPHICICCFSKNFISLFSDSG